MVSIGLFVAALLLLAAMISYSPYDIGFETSAPNIHIRNYIGIIGAYTVWAIFKLIGYAGFFIPFLFVVWGIGILAERLTGRLLYRITGILFLFSPMRNPRVSSCVPEEIPAMPLEENS